MSCNICVLDGRFTSTPELRRTQTDVAVTNFCLAVDRQYRKGEETQVDFVDFVAWRGTAEFICRNFEKGDGVNITGTIQSRNWEDSDGKKRKSIEVLVENVTFPLSSKRKESAENVNIPADDEEYPF